MDVGQKVVFVRAVKGVEVGKHGTVMKVSDNMVVVDCTLQEHLAPVLAQMWDVLPTRVVGASQSAKQNCLGRR